MTIQLEHYPDLEQLYEDLRKFQRNLMGCVNCRVLWTKVCCVPQELLEDANKLFLDASGLSAHGINDVSHGLCRLCLRDGLVALRRKRQNREKNPDCFGKVTHYCDQFLCEFRNECLIEEDEKRAVEQLMAWQARIAQTRQPTEVAQYA